MSVVTGGWGILALPIFVLAIIGWQYGTRQTLAARAALIFAVFLLPPLLALIPSPRPPLYLDYAPGTPQLANLSQLSVHYGEPGTSACRDADPVRADLLHLDLPVRVDDLPAGTALLGRVEFNIVPRNRQLPPRSSPLYASFRRKGNDYCQTINLTASQWQQIHNENATLSTTLYLTVVTDRPASRVPVTVSSVAIPGVGVCVPYAGGERLPGLVCRAGGYSPEAVLVSIEYPGFRSDPVPTGSFHASPEPVQGLSPVEKWVVSFSGNAGPSPLQITSALLRSDAALVFTPQRPLAFATRHLQVPNTRLATYLRTQ